MVVDDLQDLRLLQAGHGLGCLVVVHQHHLFPLGAQQVIPGQHAHCPILVIQDRVAGVAIFQYRFLNIVHPVFQMEAHHALGVADAAHGSGLEQQTGGAVSVEGGGDDAGLGGQIPQFFRQLCLTQHQAIHIHFHGPAHHFRLIAADDHRGGLAEQQIFVGLGQGNHHFAGDGVDIVAGVVEHFAFQHAQQVEQGHILQYAGVDAGHIVAGDVGTGQNAVQRAILPGHRQGCHIGIFLEFVPGAADGNAEFQNRRGIIIQVADLGEYIVHALGRLETEAVQNHLGLVRYRAQNSRLVFPVAQGIAQSCIGHSGYHGVGIRISMAGNINRIHNCLLCIVSNRYVIPRAVRPVGIPRLEG